MTSGPPADARGRSGAEPEDRRPDLDGTAAVDPQRGDREPQWRELARLREQSRMYDAVIDEVRGREIRIGDRWLADFASCNYLGFDLDPEIIAAMDAAVRRWGTHPGWSRLLGSPRLYPEIEERLTELLGAPDTLVLPTVTLIHMSVIPVLAGRGTLFLDANAHKTIYDGCRHARGLGATVLRFRTGDVEHLAELMGTAAAAPRPWLVCMDGMNSMTGNLPDLPGFAALCRSRGALLYVDDAHGFGVLGERRPDESSPYGSRGNSAVRHCDERYDDIVLVGGFSKAYSAMLAFIAVPTVVKNHLKVAAPPYLYSGPSPVASLAGVLAGFDVNDSRGEALRARLYRHSATVHSRVRALGIHTPSRAGTPVVELPLAPGRDLVPVAEHLWRRGVYVTLAAYPLVPRGQVGIRVQLTAVHTDEQIDRLGDTLAELAAEGAFRPIEPPASPSR